MILSVRSEILFLVKAQNCYMPSKFSNGHNIFLVDISMVLVPLLHCAELLLPIYVPLSVSEAGQHRSNELPGVSFYKELLRCSVRGGGIFHL